MRKGGLVLGREVLTAVLDAIIVSLSLSSPSSTLAC